MRPQGLWRSLVLVQLASTRSFLETGSGRRKLQTAALGASSPSRIPEFAFAFDIDGVLLRASKPIPGAAESIALLKDQGIPFILLTNGGGKHESERVAEISEKLPSAIGPLGDHPESYSLCGARAGARRVERFGEQMRDGGRRRRYGFKNVVTPGDIFMANPNHWPFSKVFRKYYEGFARPLPNPCGSKDPTEGLKIDAIFVFNDPRDWALDAQVILDVLLSSQGILGTFSEKNGCTDLPNRGYLQDGQPPLYFSNPDLVWAAAYHLPRLGQGGFREALEGTWAAITGGPSKGVELKKTIIGKPYQGTYEYAENQLLRNRSRAFGTHLQQPIRNIYMVGDNPESDIQGANTYRSPHGSQWHSLLVRTGVYSGGEPTWTPQAIVDNVQKAVEYGLNKSRWHV
ncbi:putative HAD superfamily hydrolase [Aspergillus tanneri]|uniref:HAD-superfamily subfamily IIA hydrolase n=1 Tax=Aspergillus tanneri TaxID=1220188 RepID=A0A5M9MJS0_9EURO|nr:uncharacterized protein ATNIH1004_005945 [Aspergillus tanneri]KAA8647255.1 hypothetical protein ATNIH1004_005945 [Aspergillus tanneri]